MFRWHSRLAWLFLSLWISAATVASAGMPALLPTNWTMKSSPAGHETSASSAAPYLQAISFFVAVLLISAWAVKGLWGALRKDLHQLPILSYGRSFSLVVLWGLLFVVVLTMISGARELMTPGAWKKQGWTYKIAEPVDRASVDSKSERREALQRLRLALWQYAATHEGKFPDDSETKFDQSLWEIPHWAGLRFMRVPGRHAEDAGKLFVYEPELDGEERLVILTNGMIGTMNSAEIRQALSVARAP